ncbi:hypothetical protein QOT17_008836 [Balamuthia mandrillaris]
MRSAVRSHVPASGILSLRKRRKERSERQRRHPTSTPDTVFPPTTDPMKEEKEQQTNGEKQETECVDAHEPNNARSLCLLALNDRLARLTKQLSSIHKLKEEEEQASPSNHNEHATEGLLLTELHDIQQLLQQLEGFRLNSQTNDNEPSAEMTLRKKSFANGSIQKVLSWRARSILAIALEEESKMALERLRVITYVRGKKKRRALLADQAVVQGQACKLLADQLRATLMDHQNGSNETHKKEDEEENEIHNEQVTMKENETSTSTIVASGGEMRCSEVPGGTRENGHKKPRI